MSTLVEGCVRSPQVSNPAGVVTETLQYSHSEDTISHIRLQPSTFHAPSRLLGQFLVLTCLLLPSSPPEASCDAIRAAADALSMGLCCVPSTEVPLELSVITELGPLGPPHPTPAPPHRAH